MSNLSIFEKKWLDLVFEGKNQEYGAYQLRKNSSKTTILAFFSGILFLGFVSGIGILFSSFGLKTELPSESEKLDTVIRVENYNKPVVIEKKIIEPISTNSNPIEKILVNRFLVVAATNEAIEKVVPNEELSKSNTSTSSENGTSTNPDANNSGSQDNGNSTNTISENPPVVTAVLDVQPDFPGGIDKFRKQVGEKFNTPEIDERVLITVMVSFVIEKDGSMTDIKVLRNPGYGLDIEAIRVLKSIKTKWTAGKINGESVRTQYNLPIKVQSN